MPEYDNDRLEQFFRKASGKPDVTFNEDDWKKLEARLDAEQGALVETRKAGSKVITAAAIAIILGFSGAIWVNAPADKSTDKSGVSDGQISPRQSLSALDQEGVPSLLSDESSAGNSNDQRSQDVTSTVVESNDHETPSVAGNRALQKDKIAGSETPIDRTDAFDGFSTTRIAAKDENPSVKIESSADMRSLSDVSKHRPINVQQQSVAGVKKYDDEKILNDLIRTSQISPAIAEKIKQKAVVELPGAEEETRGAEAVVREEHASEQKKHESLPRLSLLLSFAPDFSSTAYNQYTTPGRAFGAMIHYHALNRWSLSVGVIKNNKEYTGAGEDYQPPKGYWKYYTNGVIPSSIDGSCSVLEFPVMIQYTIARTGNSRWVAGAGTSSYVMLSESYRYNFEQPNPGAKEGWDSRSSSRFLFNMANITVGYERRVLPGLMIGIEPYVKVPLEEIGWSNLKLFSTGASITLRYTILGRQMISTPARSRGPD